MTNNYQEVKLTNVDQGPKYPRYQYQNKIYQFKDTTSLLLNLIDHHFYGQYRHYWYGQVPQGYPESEASRQIRTNYQYFSSLPHEPINVINLN